MVTDGPLLANGDAGAAVGGFVMSADGKQLEQSYYVGKMDFWTHQNVGPPGNTEWYSHVAPGHVTLRFGDRGLYYNSSSHGTVTFVLNDYSPRPASDDEAPDNAGDVTRQLVIVEGCHAQGPVDHAGWVAARRFALRVFVACGRAGTRTPIEALHGRAWVELLQQLGVGTAAAQCLGLAFFPWLEGGAVHELNEAALWGWISAGYSTDLATWQDWQREVLERFLRDETR